jgi:HlyD family secretion protein
VSAWGYWIPTIQSEIKKRSTKANLPYFIGGGVLFLFLASNLFSSSNEKGEEMPTFAVSRRTFPIEVRTVGELEAARSISIASLIRSDQAKIIDLIPDGTQVSASDILVKIDATPLEKKVEDLESSLKECESQIVAQEQQLAWETEQAEHDLKTALYEKESLELELNKIVHGDGPLELARLQSGMQKAKCKYDDLNAYSSDLALLQEQGFLNPVEVRLTEKKILEEQENYENAKLQYESFVDHVHPMQIKRAETALKKAVTRIEETEKTSAYKMAKAQAVLYFAKQEKENILRQLKEARDEVLLAEIRAPTPGMVVLREEYRNSQRRKPRVGDILIRNQPILDLPDLSSMTVKTKVREIDLHKIHVGKPATVEVDAFPHLQFEGKVSFIGILALSDLGRTGDEKYFEVKVALENTDPRLRPGMTARVVVHADQVDERLAVPIHAVFEKEKCHYCYLSKWRGYVEQPVTVGKSNEQWVEVITGLDEKDIISLSMPDHG